ncbi:MAG: sterol desaturase family protein [Bacteroidota bacterium]
MEQLVAKAEENIGWFIFGFFVFSMGLAIVEFFWEWHQKKLTKWRLKEMLASFMVFIPAQLTEKVGGLFFAGALFFVHDLIPWQLPVNPATTILAIIVVDFLYYWEHRWEHEIRLLWTYHSIHHSSPIYNYTTAMRVSFMDSFVSWIFYVPAVLLGFHPVLVVLALAFILGYQFWIHTELIRNMGWFEWLFNSPSHHRVHHGSDDEYLDKNYGGLLIIWDRMFGTFQKEEFQATYGLTKQINTINPLRVHFGEHLSILKDLRRARSWKEAIKYIFGKPGWQPETQKIKS